jgi:hypothetical protein
LLLLQMPDRQSLGTAQVWPSFFLHAPAASHLLAPVHESGSSVPVTATQVPPAPVHDWQGPQVWLQQRLSVQDPTAHSSAAGAQLSP